MKPELHATLSNSEMRTYLQADSHEEGESLKTKKKRDLKHRKDLASLCRLTAHAGMKLAISQTRKDEQMKLNEKNSSDMKVLILCKTKED